MLVTHDCTIDKRNRRGEPTSPLFHFLPVLAVSAQDRNKQAAIRRNEMTPREVLFLGDCGELGEAFVLLHEVYGLPAALFRPYVDPFENHPAAQPGEQHLAVRDGDSRVGRLPEGQVDMLRVKWSVYWTRIEPMVSGTDSAPREQTTEHEGAALVEAPPHAVVDAAPAILASLPWPLDRITNDVAARLRSVLRW